MKISCELEEFLSVLKEFREKGVETLSLEVDDKLEGLKLIPSNSVLPKTIGKIVKET